MPEPLDLRTQETLAGSLFSYATQIHEHAEFNEPLGAEDRAELWTEFEGSLEGHLKLARRDFTNTLRTTFRFEDSPGNGFVLLDFIPPVSRVAHEKARFLRITHDTGSLTLAKTVKTNGDDFRDALVYSSSAEVKDFFEYKDLLFTWAARQRRSKVVPMHTGRPQLRLIQGGKKD